MSISMNTCSGFLGLLPRRLREGLGIPSLAKPLREPRMRFPTFLKRNKALCILPRPYGARSPFEKQTRLGGAGPGAPHGWGNNAPNNFNSLTPLQDLHGIVTPSALHFERHHNGVPAIDPARHRLLVFSLLRPP